MFVIYPLYHIHTMYEYPHFIISDIKVIISFWYSLYQYLCNFIMRQVHYCSFFVVKLILILIVIFYCFCFYIHGNFLKCFIWLSIFPPFCDEFPKHLNNYYICIYNYHCIYRVAMYVSNILFPNPISNLVYKALISVIFLKLTKYSYLRTYQFNINIYKRKYISWP